MCIITLHAYCSAAHTSVIVNVTMTSIHRLDRNSQATASMGNGTHLIQFINQQLKSNDNIIIYL